MVQTALNYETVYSYHSSNTNERSKYNAAHLTKSCYRFIHNWVLGEHFSCFDMLLILQFTEISGSFGNFMSQTLMKLPKETTSLRDEVLLLAVENATINALCFRTILLNITKLENKTKRLSWTTINPLFSVGVGNKLLTLFIYSANAT